MSKTSKSEVWTDWQVADSEAMRVRINASIARLDRVARTDLPS